MSTMVNVWGRGHAAANATNVPVVDLESPVIVNIDRPHRDQAHPMPQMSSAASDVLDPVFDRRADNSVTVNVYCCCCRPCGSSNSPPYTPMECSPSASEDGNTADFKPDLGDLGKGKNIVIGHP